MKNLRIAVASGKGGTGKTTLATNLASVVAAEGKDVTYLDCDVEEPNGHIFLKPEITSSKPVGNLIPKVDEEKCIHCGKCGEICQYSAIVCIGEKVLVYPELCHACGGCSLVCPAEAISFFRTITVCSVTSVSPSRADLLRFIVVWGHQAGAVWKPGRKHFAGRRVEELLVTGERATAGRSGLHRTDGGSTWPHTYATAGRTASAEGRINMGSVPV